MLSLGRWCQNWVGSGGHPAGVEIIGVRVRKTQLPHAGIGFQNHTTHINPFKSYSPTEQAFWCLLHMRLRFREIEELASGRAGVWTPNNRAEGLRTVAGSVGHNDWPWGGPQGSPDTHGLGTCNLTQKSVPNQSKAFVRNLGLKAHSRVCGWKQWCGPCFDWGLVAALASP